MDLVTFLVWLFTVRPAYNCTTDIECTVQCQQFGDVDCEY